MDLLAGEDGRNERYVCRQSEGDPLRDPVACQCGRPFP